MEEQRKVFRLGSKLKRYIDEGFEELNARMKNIGYSYERGSRSFVK